MAQAYGEYRLPDLWAMVAGEDPEAGFVHVNALNRLRTSLEQQRDNLRAQRDRLIEGWPPERSEAAALFVDRVNNMITAMTYTAEAAGRMCNGVDEAFAAIRDARRQLEPLAASGRQGAELDQRGREVLIAADAKVASASGLINTSVPSYKRIDVRQPISQNTAETDGSGGSTGSSSARTSGTSMQSALLPAPTFDPPSSSGSVAGSGVDAGPLVGDSGPVLAGDRPVAPAPVPSGVIGGSGPSHTTAPVANGPYRFDAVGQGGVIGLPRPSPTARGDVTGTPMTGPGQRPASGRASTSAEPTQGRTLGGMPGGYRDHSYEAYSQRHRSKRTDNDELWSVEEGVAPVLEAATEVSHDPGSGVLGIDR
ncbi:hypothetical protein AB0M46_29425 [Dactylosporangium sp. NPDC051485]|uniref:hypothetical protein n=1 Tax=Dactylosporangium sp. NPDC051485 TaxID=3154846 RepID=UPI00341F2A20